jgi:hypothetical protein
MNIFQLQGMALIPDTTKPDLHGEKDAMTYSKSGTVKTLF